MLAMQFELRNIWSSPVYVEEPPPIRETRQRWSRVLIEAVVEIVAEHIADANKDQPKRPIVDDGGYH